MRFIMLAFMLLSCTANQQLQPQTIYKRDIQIVFEGQTYLGLAVLPARDQYQLQLTFPGQVDLFTFRTCHREITQEDAGGTGRIFSSNNVVKMTYVPQEDMEKDRYCPVELGGYEEAKGRNAWGFVDFEGPRDTLSALLLCNGERKIYGGASVCQSLAGLMQEIVFAVPVKISPDDSCPMPLSGDGLKYRFPINRNRCVYEFKEKTGEGRFHRLTTIGYESIPIRKGA